MSINNDDEVNRIALAIQEEMEDHKYCGMFNCSCTFASHYRSIYWHPTENKGVKPGHVALGNTDKYWFLCPDCGHKFKQDSNSIYGRNSWCQYCSLKWEHCKDINCDFCFERSIAYDEISISWDYTLNKGVSPFEITPMSDKYIWTICNECGHSNEAITKNITKGLRGCIQCSTKHWSHCGDDNCMWCYHKSFKSNPKFAFWNETKNAENKIDALYISDNSSTQCWMTCNVCYHDFLTSPGQILQGNWCLYCSSSWKHCGKEECQYCLNRSFKSHPKCEFFINGKLNNNVNPLYIAKHARDAYWFLCPDCGHNISIPLHSVTKGDWCGFCSTTNWKHCKNHDCNFCFKRSFAMHPRAVNWDYDKNRENYPWLVAPFSSQKRYFKCDVCKTTFESKVAHVSLGHFCRKCKNKTEKKLHKFLQSLSFIETVCQEKKFEWCKSKIGNMLPFDEYANECAIIEGDGDQHFKQVSNWTPHLDTQERDLFKMKMAFENGKSVIRIYQEDIYRDRNQWQYKLTEALKKILSSDKPTYIFIKTNKTMVNDTYDMYAAKCDEYLRNIK